MQLLTRHIKWICLHILLLLVLFLMYRIFIFNKFNVTHEGFKWQMLWYAFRYDMRVIGIIVLPIFLVSSLARLSPFHHKGAKIFWQFYLTIAYTIVLLFFITDYQYYAYRTTRLDAELLSFMKDAAISAKMMWQTYPVVFYIFWFVHYNYSTVYYY